MAVSWSIYSRIGGLAIGVITFLAVARCGGEASAYEAAGTERLAA